MSFLTPRITDMNDERQKYTMNQFMQGLRDMSFKLTFLDNDGGVTSGRKPYNFDAVWLNYVSNATKDTEDTVAHNLGRIPKGALIGLADKAGTVYDGGTAWTSTNVFLKADVASLTVDILLF